jgi:predicted AAA+ superfamily ATPase
LFSSIKKETDHYVVEVDLLVLFLMQAEQRGLYIMGIWIERDLYNDLLHWKRKHLKLSLILGGCRQSGKTSLLERFGKNEFASIVTVDLSDAELRIELESCLKKHYRTGTMTERDGEFIEKAFREVGKEFKNDSCTLIIVDEVQESAYVHNKIRHFTRGLNCKCAFTGSYMSEVNLGKDFREAAGDTYFLTLYPVSFVEFARAEGVLGEFNKLDIFKKKFSVLDSRLLEKVNNLYNVYCEIGGYPNIVSEYLETRDVFECKSDLSGLVHNIYGELEKRFNSGMTYELWDYTSKAVAKALVFNKEFQADLEEISEVMSNESVAYAPNKERVWMALKWMKGCNIVNAVPVATQKVFTDYIPINKFFFTDIGIFQEIVAKVIVDKGSLIGYVAEQFVFLSLLTLKALFMNGWVESYHKTGDEFEEEVDFVVCTKTGKILLIEVKATGGSTKSSNRLLETKRADYMVKFEDHTGIIQKDRAVLPVWGVIHLKKIVELLDAEKIGVNVSDEVFSSSVKSPF